MNNGNEKSTKIKVLRVFVNAIVSLLLATVVFITLKLI